MEHGRDKNEHCGTVEATATTMKTRIEEVEIEGVRTGGTQEDKHMDVESTNTGKSGREANKKEKDM